MHNHHVQGLSILPLVLAKQLAMHERVRKLPSWSPLSIILIRGGPRSCLENDSINVARDDLSLTFRSYMNAVYRKTLIICVTLLYEVGSRDERDEYEEGRHAS